MEGFKYGPKPKNPINCKKSCYKTAAEYAQLNEANKKKLAEQKRFEKKLKFLNSAWHAFQRRLERTIFSPNAQRRIISQLNQPIPQENRRSPSVNS